MPTDPSSIPEYAVEIAQEAMMNAHLRDHLPPKPDAWQVAIAAALDALFPKSESVALKFADTNYVFSKTDVLAAVLNRTKAPKSQKEVGS